MKKLIICLLVLSYAGTALSQIAPLRKAPAKSSTNNTSNPTSSTNRN